MSNNRAKSVTDYLKSKGIEGTRMTSIGLGDAKPISDNNTEEGRASNRRTEFRITSVR
ncbi:MAG: OmpA family protein [Bacteroidota bacterium]